MNESKPDSSLIVRLTSQAHGYAPLNHTFGTYTQVPGQLDIRNGVNAQRRWSQPRESNYQERAPESKKSMHSAQQKERE